MVGITRFWPAPAEYWRKPLSLTTRRGTTWTIQMLIFSLLIIQRLYYCKNQKDSAHDIQCRRELHRVQIQPYSMRHFLPNPLSMHYISLDHPKAHEFTNHILQPSVRRRNPACGPQVRQERRCTGGMEWSRSPTGTTGSFPRIL